MIMAERGAPGAAPGGGDWENAAPVSPRPLRPASAPLSRHPSGASSTPLSPRSPRVLSPRVPSLSAPVSPAARMAESIERAAVHAMHAALGDQALPTAFSPSSDLLRPTGAPASSRCGVDSKVLLAVVRRAIAKHEAELRRENARLADTSVYLCDSWTEGIGTLASVENETDAEEAEVLEPMRALVIETRERTFGARPEVGKLLGSVAAARANIALTVREAKELVASTGSLASAADEMEVLASKVAMDTESIEGSSAMYELTARTITYIKTSDLLGRLLEQRPREQRDTGAPGLARGMSDGQLVALQRHHDALERARRSLETAFDAVAMDADRLAHQCPAALVSRVRALELLERAVRIHNAMEWQVEDEERPSAGAGVALERGGEDMSVPEDGAHIEPKTDMIPAVVTVAPPRRRAAALVSTASPREAFIRKMLEVAAEHAHTNLAWEEGQDATVLLEAASALVDRLHTVRSIIAPCFPRDYDLVRRFAELYHGFFVQLFELFVECIAEDGKASSAAGRTTHFVSNAAILAALGWVPWYFQTLRLKYKIEAPEELQPPLSTAADALLASYVERTRRSLKTWADNIARADATLEPTADANGRLSSPAFVDVMRLVSDQVRLVQDVNGKLLLEVGAAGMDAFLRFQQQLMKAVKAPLEDEGAQAKGRRRHGRSRSGDADSTLDAYAHEEQMRAELLELALARMASMANSCLVAASEMVPYAESIARMLQGPHALAAFSLMDARAVARAFAETAAAASDRSADIVLHDIIAKLLPELFTDRWARANAADSVVGSMVATLEDYSGDLRRFMDPPVFTATMNACLEKTVVGYLGALVLKTPRALPIEWLSQAQADEMLIADFFSRFVEGNAAGMGLLETSLSAMAAARSLVFAADERETIAAAVHMRAKHNVSDAMLERILAMNSVVDSIAVRSSVLSAIADATASPGEERAEHEPSKTEDACADEDCTDSPDRSFEPFALLEEEAGGARRIRRRRTIDTAVTSAVKQLRSAPRLSSRGSRWAVQQASAKKTRSIMFADVSLGDSDEEAAR